MAEQTIRVSAKGEFAQLQRGLKQLQGDLRNVVGEINKGARKGGIFDDANLRALDVFRRRLVESFGEARKQIDQQANALDRLVSAMNKASGSQKDAIRKEIKERGDLLDKMEAEYRAIEKIYNMRRKESEEYNRKARAVSSGGGGSKRAPSEDEGGGGSGGSSGGGSLIRGLVGAGKLGLGLAGIGGIISELTKAYSLAYARETDSLDLSQRMRGANGWSGSNVNQFDRSANAGMANGMGYTSAESWQFLDQYTRQAGGMDTGQMGSALRFGRGYGLNTGEVAGALGGNRAIGGTGSPKEFADAIAGSVGSSGMTPRILEVMEVNNTLLQQMNTSLKDGSAKQILAYQTTLDSIGMKKGMMQLTGSQGANLIGGMGGIFKPGDDNWKWMGIRALQGYDPEKYGKMGMFDLESSFEDGLMNKDNIPAMGKYIKGISGGNKNLEKRMMQKWLTDGGFAATKREAGEFYDATDGLSSFNADAMSKLQGGAIDSGAKYDEREGLKGQGYLDTEARYTRALEQIGAPIVESVNLLKEGITVGLEALAGMITGSGSGNLTELLAFMNKNLVGLGLDINLASLPKFVESVSTKLFGDKNPIDGLLGNPYQNAYSDMYGGKAPSWISSKEQLDPTSPSFFRSDPRWTGDKPTEGATDDQKKLYEFFAQEEAKSTRKKEEETRRGTSSWTNDLGTDIGDFLQKATSGMINKIFGGNKVQKDVEDLSKKGVSFLESMDTNAEKKLSDVYDEHKGFKVQMAGYFAPVADFFMRMGNGLSQGGGGGVQLASFRSGGMGSSVLGNSTTASKLNEKLGGVLSGYGQAFDFAGKKYGIDPAFLAAVAMHETGNGTSDAARNKHNIGGMMGKGGLMTFGSTLEGLDAMSSNLKRNYIDQGLVTIDQIQKKYAPVGADNDPTGLNNHWTNGVGKFMNELGGSSTGAVNDDLAGSLIQGGAARTASTKSESTVNVNLTGDAADKLNSLTKEQLISLVKKIMVESDRNQKSLTPTKAGYST